MKTFDFAPRLGLVASALACAFPALAQQTPTTLPEVVVTATRLETRTDTLLSDVTIIDSTDLEQQSGRTLTEIISRVAGLQMSASGGRGNTTSIFVRGTEGRHVLLLVDGVRMGSATVGLPSFDNIALDSIERIEVLKGPSSALYGSDAIGGVIQIFTKKGTKAFSSNISSTVGSNGYKAANAGLSGSGGQLRYAIGVGAQSENGISGTNEKEPFGSFNADKDPYRQTNGYASFALDLVNGWVLDTRLSAATGVGHWDNGPGTDNPSTDLRTQTMSVGLKGKINPNWSIQLRIGKADDKSTSHSAWGDGKYNTQNRLVSWINEVQTPLGTVLAGLEKQTDVVDSSDDYDQSRRNIQGVFVGLTGSQGANSWQINARRDKNSQFGEATTGFVAYGYRVNANLKAHASYGTSFKAPTFNQLYYPGFGNATTQPEKGKNKELGLTYSQGLQEVKFTRFDNRIQGFITEQPIVTNIPQARMQGWTVGYQTEWGNNRLRSTVDLLDARNVKTDKWLARRANQQLTLGAETRLGDWTVGGDLLAVSQRFDDAANTDSLAGFATLDLYANYSLNRDWKLQAKLNNLADKVYETARGYNQAGRSVFVTLSYQPK